MIAIHKRILSFQAWLLATIIAFVLCLCLSVIKHVNDQPEAEVTVAPGESQVVTEVTNGESQVAIEVIDNTLVLSREAGAKETSE